MRRAFLRACPAAVLVALLAAAACFHTVGPVATTPLATEEADLRFPPGTRLRLVGGDDGPRLLRIGDKGFHRLDVDLEEWTRRLRDDLARDLERRGAQVIRRDEPDGADAVVYRIALVEVSSPRRAEGRGAALAAELNGRRFVSESGATGFFDAFRSLRLRMLLSIAADQGVAHGD